MSAQANQSALPLNWEELCAHPQVDALVALAILEDVGDGDITSRSIFPDATHANARIITREPVVVCGVPLALHLLQERDPEATLVRAAPEGSALNTNDELCAFEADLRAILEIERCMLNFLMRLCGIATGVRWAIEALPSETRARLYDTRKTMPGWRLLDKKAVRVGGAHNHRMGLFDAMLIKDNHVEAAGNVAEAVRRAKDRSDGVPVQVEVDRVDQIEDAICAGADLILLDNFTLETMRQAVKRVAGRVPIEVSGGVQIERIADIARTGVDRISMGALTHSVKPSDLSLELCG